jgi:hypothetical protein
MAASKHARARNATMPRQRELSADCERCDGLCCVSLPFDRGEWFSFDKPADVPCHHLLGNGRCAVHAARAELGLSGCVRYDCCGAGQRVTRELEGSSWRTDPTLIRRACELFRTLATVHELLLLLREAARLLLTTAERRERERLVLLLEPPTERSPEDWRNFDTTTADKAVHEFLRALGDRLSRPKRRLGIFVDTSRSAPARDR